MIAPVAMQEMEWSPLTIFWASYAASVLGSLGAMFVSGQGISVDRVGAAICFWGVLGCGAGTFGARYLSGPNKALETIAVSGILGALLGSGQLKISELTNGLRRLLGVSKDDDDDPSKNGRNPTSGQ